MDGVQFEEDQEFGKPFATLQPKKPKLVQLVLSTGIVKSDEHAQYMLLGIAVISFVLMIFFFASAFGGSDSSNLSEQEIQRMQQQSGHGQNVRPRGL